uniref:Uncharacterized protein n=1 Tax=Setaria italica TaxID=4555 RepID=K3YZT8_SETIT
MAIMPALIKALIQGRQVVVAPFKTESTSVKGQSMLKLQLFSLCGRLRQFLGDCTVRHQAHLKDAACLRSRN